MDPKMSLELAKVKQVTDAWNKIQTQTARTQTQHKAYTNHFNQDPQAYKYCMLQCQEGSMCLVARQTNRHFE